MFYQYVIDRVFDGLIKQHYKLDKLEKMSVEVKLTYEEQNALRYTCGYVTRALIKKLKHSAHPLKEEMVCCLVELNEPEEDIKVTEYREGAWFNNNFASVFSLQLLRRCSYYN